MLEELHAVTKHESVMNELLDELDEWFEGDPEERTARDMLRHLHKRMAETLERDI